MGEWRTTGKNGSATYEIRGQLTEVKGYYIYTGNLFLNPGIVL